MTISRYQHDYFKMITKKTREMRDNRRTLIIINSSITTGYIPLENKFENLENHKLYLARIDAVG